MWEFNNHLTQLLAALVAKPPLEESCLRLCALSVYLHCLFIFELPAGKSAASTCRLSQTLSNSPRYPLRQEGKFEPWGRQRYLGSARGSDLASRTPVLLIHLPPPGLLKPWETAWLAEHSQFRDVAHCPTCWIDWDHFKPLPGTDGSGSKRLLVAFTLGLNSPVSQDFLFPFVVKVKKISLLKFIYTPTPNWCTIFFFSMKWRREVFCELILICDPMDCSLPGFSVCGILQARILEWVAISSSRGSSQPRDQTWVSHIAGSFFTIWATRQAPLIYVYFFFF